MVRKIQSVTAKPLSIDTPDPAIARAGLAAYDPAGPAAGSRSSTRSPPLRAGMFDLYALQPFRPILLVSEQVVDGRRSRAARRRRPMRRPGSWSRLPRALPGSTNDDCIIDPGIAPIGSDCEGNLKRLIQAME